MASCYNSTVLAVPSVKFKFILGFWNTIILKWVLTLVFLMLSCRMCMYHNVFQFILLFILWTCVTWFGDNSGDNVPYNAFYSAILRYQSDLFENKFLQKNLKGQCMVWCASSISCYTGFVAQYLKLLCRNSYWHLQGTPKMCLLVHFTAAFWGFFGIKLYC